MMVKISFSTIIIWPLIVLNCLHCPFPNVIGPRPQASFTSPDNKISLWSSFLSLFCLLSVMYWASAK